MPSVFVFGERSGRRIVDGPANGQGGLYAILGPGRAIQIRSWRVRPASDGSHEGVRAAIQPTNRHL